MKNNLHPGVRWAFRVRAFFLCVFLMVFFSVWALPIVSFTILSTSGTGTMIIHWGTFFALAAFYIVTPFLIAEVYARMAYARWMYEWAADSLRIERGIILKKYSSIPYSRIQNVEIQRGIVARVCGFSTVSIQTAGISVADIRTQNEGTLPGVGIQEAEQIRDTLMKYSAQQKPAENAGMRP